MAINGVSSINTNTIDSILGIKKNTNIENSNDGFGKYLTDAISKINDTQQVAEKDKALVATGHVDNLHDIMIDSQKAELTLQYAVQVRNKVVDAYNEIMRISL